MIARRKGNAWYVGGINADMRNEKTKKLKFDFLPVGTRYQLTLIADGKHDKAFSVQHLVVEKASIIDVRMLRHGGFAACLLPLQ
jgi:alpha-glucosidase